MAIDFGRHRTAPKPPEVVDQQHPMTTPVAPVSSFSVFGAAACWWFGSSGSSFLALLQRRSGTARFSSLRILVPAFTISILFL